AYGIAAAVIVLLWAVSGVYVVAANEQAVIQTFGAYTGWNGPGLNYHLPWPIQKVTKVGVTNIRGLNIGGTETQSVENESLVLTGDKDIVDMRYTVQWRIARPQDFLFNLKDPEGAVKAVAESAMREVVGRNALQPIITSARGQVETQVSDLMQRVLDSYGAGVAIEEVQISVSQPPPRVMGAFRDVQSAQQDREAKANNARGQASQITQAALGDKALAIQGAEGEAAAFNQVYTQYKVAPAITRQRLYIETMEKVLSKSQKIIVDNKGASAPIILPPDAFRPRPGVQNNVVGPAPQVQAPRGRP
ncbi:MAG: FtsH protease activity modulator HflK, partial [Alphaproteobacteria bacterium]